MEQSENKILIHACCGICSGYPIACLLELDYLPIVYFSNSNLDTLEEFERRLNAQKIVCNYYNVPLYVDVYDHLEYLKCIKGFEEEPERGLRCNKCIELRLRKTVQKALELNINKFTTSLPISPHKNFKKISELGINLGLEYGIEYLAIDFKKKDGFLKSNNLSKKLDLYRQNYCGCEFAK